MSGTSSARSQRPTPSVSPFRSRKSPATKSAGRPVTPSSMTSSRQPSKLSVSPTATVSPSPSPSPSPPTLTLDRPDISKSKENVTVTVRFRPLRSVLSSSFFLWLSSGAGKWWFRFSLRGPVWQPESSGLQTFGFWVLSSAREINKGDEIAWYADGDYMVRNEYSPSIAYGFGSYRSLLLPHSNYVHASKINVHFYIWEVFISWELSLFNSTKPLRNCVSLDALFCLCFFFFFWSLYAAENSYQKNLRNFALLSVLSYLLLLKVLRLQRFLVVLYENLTMDAADRVFGPATTTRHVYDVAAQHVVSGTMHGINGNYLT